MPIAFEDTAAPTPISITGTWTSGSTTISSVSSLTGIEAGAQITAVGIRGDTTIASFNAGASTLTLSKTTTNAGTTQPLYVYPAGPPSVVPPSRAVSMPQGSLREDGSWIGDTPGGFYNFDSPRRLARFRAARAAVTSQFPWLSDATPNVDRDVLIIGDGMASGNEPNVGDWKLAPSYAMARKLGVPYSYAGVSVNGAPDTDRIVLGAGWETLSLPGFTHPVRNYTDETAAEFDPGFAWDRAVVVYNDIWGLAWNWRIDAGAPTVRTNGSTDAWLKFTVTADTSIIQTLKFAPETGGACSILSVTFYNSATRAMRVVNLADSGGAFHQIVTTGGSGTAMSPANLKTLYDPALVVLHGGQEVPGQLASPGTAAATVVATFKTNMSTMIELWQAEDVDLILMSMHPWDETDLYHTQATTVMLRRAFYEMANEYDVPLIDNIARWGTYPEAQAAGLIQHYGRPMVAGNYDLGGALAHALALP